ncbi:tetratricopeptide repeat protein [Halopseudomonas phragmitis]|uniref:tetratricopeptide repeat protein n=1 Tax=Halopseudomonas phragmitis TaxID=1931241 RepID=UPI0012BAB4BB|nr:tetratricopeptide repeat protein [Halopseudomonas phragmitis]
MEAFTILFIIAAVAAVWVWVKKSQKNSPKQAANELEPKLDQYHQAISATAQRLVEIINESLKIANESKNADTKVSRLDVAKKRLEELKKLSDEHSFIKLTQLSKVEQSIADLEQEFLQAQYREAAEGNMRGQELEKEGNVDAAILEYERLLEEGVDTPFTYRRLAIIYSKRKETDEELRVLRAAIKNIPVENSTHYKWFAERLAKK